MCIVRTRGKAIIGMARPYDCLQSTSGWLAFQHDSVYT